MSIAEIEFKLDCNLNSAMNWMQTNQITLNIKGQLFKRSLASVQQNGVLSHFQFTRLFYLNTIYREKFHKSIRRRLDKHRLTFVNKYYYTTAWLIAKQELITRTSFVYKTSRLVRISLLISILNKDFCCFLGKVILKNQYEIYFLWASRNIYSTVANPQLRLGFA